MKRLKSLLTDEKSVAGYAYTLGMFLGLALYVWVTP